MEPTSAIWAGRLARDMDSVLATALLLHGMWGAVLLEAGQSKCEVQREGVRQSGPGSVGPAVSFV